MLRLRRLAIRLFALWEEMLPFSSSLGYRSSTGAWQGTRAAARGFRLSLPS